MSYVYHQMEKESELKIIITGTLLFLIRELTFPECSLL